MNNKLRIFLFSLLIGLTAAALTIAFTGPGSNAPGSGNPDFWIKSGDDVYYSGGKVGIATSTPNALLDIQKTGTGDLLNISESAGGDLLTVDNSGNVGIGTTAPGSKLEVVGEVRGTRFAFQDDTDTYIDTVAANQIGFTVGGSTTFKTAYLAGAYGMLYAYGSGTKDYPSYTWLDDANTGMFNAGTDTLGFTTGATERMRIDSTGNVGIGTIAPDERLHVEGNLMLDAYGNGGSGNGLFFREGFDSSANTYNLGLILYDDGDGSPDALDIAAYDGIYFNTGSNSRNPRMVVTGSGNVGIGTTGPTHLLQLNGGAYCDGTGDWIAGSDRAYKKDIDYNFKYGLGEVMKLKPVSFIHKKDKENRKQIGFIAQDVLPIIPELVGGKPGSYGLSYGQFSAVLVEAIKQQQQEIEDLKSQIKSLKKAK